MSLFTVALLQIAPVPGDPPANLARGEAACRRAAALGADLALFPEMWSHGYAIPAPADLAGRAPWAATALGSAGPFVAHFRALARELGMAIGLTYLEQWPGLPRNTLAVIDRYGEVALTYAKVHTCDFDREAALTPGDGFGTASLDTAAGPVLIGSMICYDREFPESARVLMLQGAEILLVPNSCAMERNRLDELRVRAMENMVGVALANYPAPHDNGHSVAYHPIAFAPDESSRDMLIVEAGEQEGIYLAPFDLEAIRAYREREAFGNTYRKPRAYGLLTADAVAPPFVRPDARR